MAKSLIGLRSFPQSEGGFARWMALLAVLLLSLVAAVDVGIGVVRLAQERKMLPNSLGGQIDLVTHRTDSGLTVWVPRNVYAPGAAQLISTTPDGFNARLELRGPNLRDGFRIRKSEDH